MFGGVSDRISAMCRFRRDAEGKEGFCAPEEERAKAVEIVAKDDGSLALDNGEIVVVIGGPKSAAHGAIVDAIEAHVGEDALESLTSCFGAPLGCLVTSELSHGKEADGSAWIVARGSTQGDARISVATRYLLVPGSRVLLVTTKVASQADEPVVIPALGDVVRWSSAEEVVHVEDPAAGDAVERAFVAATGPRVAYAIAPAIDRSTLEATRGAEGTSVVFGKAATLSKDGSLRYERLFVVSPRGDTLGVRTELALVREGRAPGAIEVRFVSAEGKPLPPPAGGRVELASSSDPLDVFAFLQIGPSATEPSVAAEAPPGHYELDLRAVGLRALAQGALRRALGRGHGGDALDRRRSSPARALIFGDAGTIRGGPRARENGPTRIDIPCWIGSVENVFWSCSSRARPIVSSRASSRRLPRTRPSSARFVKSSRASRPPPRP